MIGLLAPWQHVADDEARRFEVELRRELSSRHVLSGKTARAVARRQDCDDVLFDVGGGTFAVVHLTWSQELDPNWPATQLYSSFADWIERRMNPDHEEFSPQA